MKEFIGERVKITLKGGLSPVGIVQKFEDDTLMLGNEDNENLFIIYNFSKNVIAALVIINEGSRDNSVADTGTIRSAFSDEINEEEEVRSPYMGVDPTQSLTEPDDCDPSCGGVYEFPYCEKQVIIDNSPEEDN
jgi:hypothetical protein